MRAKRKQRLIFVIIILLGFSAATALGLFAMRENIMLFHTPTEVASGNVPADTLFRIGGVVVEGSVDTASDGLTTKFDLTDTEKSVTVQYTGLLPDLFREGQGIVAQGKLNQSGLFVAQEVLAKHDENYMPPEVADALKASGASHPDNIPKQNY